MTADAIHERWSEIIEELKARRYVLTAALLAEAMVDCESLPDGDQRLRVLFRYSVLEEKWRKTGNSERLGEVLSDMFGLRLAICSAVDEETQARLAAMHQAVGKEVRARRQPKATASSEWKEVVRFGSPDGPGLIICPNCRNGKAVEVWATTVGREGPSIGLRCSGCGIAFRLVVRALDGELCLGAEVDREDARDSRRAFNREQRRELWLSAGGRCTICRVKLGADWQADHVKPHSKGGRTEVGNGQALCGDCNRRKRDAWEEG